MRKSTLHIILPIVTDDKETEQRVVRERLWKPVIAVKIDSDRKPGCCESGFALSPKQKFPSAM